MKKIKKIFALLIAMVMVLGMSTAVFAQPVGTAADGKGSITISNASKGETYAVYKLFSATNSAAQTAGVSDSIAYTGTIPASLSAYFEADTAGNITAKAAAYTTNAAGERELTEAARTALSNWTKEEGVTAAASVVSDGSELTFQGLDYGYYVVTTTQGDQAISVDSTRPNAEIIDKNTTPPINNPTKTVDDDDVFVGQTVTYTVKFATANYDGTKQIVSYTVKDTPATGSLENINVTSIIVDNDGDTTTTTDQTTLTVQQFTNNQITIPWVSGNATDGYSSLYKNGATLIITYTAKVAATAAVDGAGNTNEVELSYKTDDNQNHPYENKITETIFTYALAIKKVDQAGRNLAGAVFELPFYVNKTAATDGAYVAIDSRAYAALSDVDKANYTNSLTTPADGLIKIKGIQQGTYSFTETAAPAGYNKLTDPVSVDAVKTGSTTTSVTTYFDADGNKVNEHVETGFDVTVSIEDLAATPVVVVNKTGAELPSTGGIGTTIFYIIGAILVIGAGVVLVTRRRMKVQ